VGALSKHGLSDPWRSRSDDIAVVDQSQGFLAQCDWLKVDLRQLTSSDGTTVGATIAWIDDEEPAGFAAPHAWHPRRSERISSEELARDYEVVKVDTDAASGGSVISYRHRLTGRTMYIGRTAPPDSLELQQRHRALSEECARLMGMPDSPQRAAAAAELYEQTTALVAKGEPAPATFLLQGVAARLANEWSKAELVFRRMTELWPDYREAWLELTWTLAELGRPGEAETAARRAVDIDDQSAAAHANLATTLLQQGRPQEALPAIERSLELDPSDTVSRRVEAQVREALGRQSARPERAPWYKRWFR